jgi:hypothetical protein
MAACEICGRSTDAHDRHVRFQLPDPVLDTELQDQAPGTWQTADDANESVMMQVPNVGPFVRALLPVRLTGGFTVTYGVWVGIHPDDLQRAFKVWWEPEFSDLRLDGFLGNGIQPWGLLGLPVELAVLDAGQTPYCVGSSDGDLAAVLSREWPHDEVLGTLP